MVAGRAGGSWMGITLNLHDSNSVVEGNMLL